MHVLYVHVPTRAAKYKYIHTLTTSFPLYLNNFLFLLLYSLFIRPLLFLGRHVPLGSHVDCASAQPQFFL